FQAEDGIRDRNVTGVQTCALPICWILWALARYINFADIRCDVGFSKYFISHCYCCHVGPIVKKRVESDRFSKCTDFWQTDPFKSAQFKRGGLYRGGAIDWYE